MFSQTVVVGRYTIVSHGHLAQVRKAREISETVTVALLDLEVGCTAPDDETRYPEGEKFLRLCDINCAPRRNPFTLAERMEMWRAAILTEFDEGTVRAERTLRPELFPAEFNRQFPSATHQLLTTAPSPTCSEFDRLRTKEFETRLSRDVVEIEPDFVQHTSDLVRNAKVHSDWQRVVAPGAVGVFMEIDGPRRLRAAYEVDWT